MTTQHTQPEHSDVEIDVAEYSSASEISTSPSSSATTLPVDETQAEQTEAVEAIETGETAETTIVAEEEVRPFTDFIEEFRQAEERFKAFLQTYQAATTGATPEPAETAPSEPLESAASLTVEAAPKFIAPADEQLAPMEAETTPTELTEPPTSQPGSSVGHITPTDVERAPTQPIEPPISYDVEVEATLNASQLTTPEETTTPTKVLAPPERPVSPLLRPASRMRLPRHGPSRHREEVSVEKKISSEPEIPAQPPVEEARVEAPVTEAAPAQEQPRPARRYRFDRKTNGSTVPSPVTTPASSAKPQTPAAAPTQIPSRGEENKDVVHRGTTPTPTHPENEYATNGQTVEREVQSVQQAKQPATGTNGIHEQAPPKQPTVQEPPIEEASTTTATPEQDRRRRHGQDRQRGKEQPTPAPTSTAVPVTPAIPPIPPGLNPVAEVVPVEPEPVTPQLEEVNPEDLPPLEYSELQKASSRRRRRRHAAASTPTPLPTKATETPPLSALPAATPTTPTTPTAPTTPTPTPSVSMPRTPAAPHKITSGYTLNQMKQSHDGASPFMGPEPSPARGSIAAQHARSIRTDAQRTPVYPVRTTEATSASVQQLASVVAQALQTQTDRMIAELRRANQTPTNISVSLPPFPSTERVGVFVDVANLLYSARTLRITIDFGKLLDFLRGNRRLVRAHAYCPTSPQPGDEQMFLQAVKGLGYRITTKNYKTFSSGAKKADLDLDLCMDVVRLVDGKAVDCIVLVSGDSDFMPMLDYCSDHGVRVEVAAFDEAMSASLRQSCDLFINLGMLEEIRA